MPPSPSPIGSPRCRWLVIAATAASALTLASACAKVSGAAVTADADVDGFHLDLALPMDVPPGGKFEAGMSGDGPPCGSVSCMPTGGLYCEMIGNDCGDTHHSVMPQ